MNPGYLAPRLRQGIEVLPEQEVDVLGRIEVVRTQAQEVWGAIEETSSEILVTNYTSACGRKVDMHSLRMQVLYYFEHPWVQFGTAAE
jgi:hypothetical protein